jgi:hydroxyacylglutathione hydrolase
MFFERIESEGLAHNSYLIGDGQEAAVIDPRRDCEIYVRRAIENGLGISHILETHRNEDYVIGSMELAVRTGAKVWHADSQLAYQYGQPVEDGQSWRIGGLSLRAMLTPGHTEGSISYLLLDQDRVPWMVFTGDTLFAGDVGRVDLVAPERTQEMAEMLYESLFGKLLPLGDGIIVCPGHGSGSVCGSAISERPLTTIGLERERNPKLQFTERTKFVSEMAVQLERPPYFRRMEMLNIQGPPVMASLPTPKPYTAEEFSQRAAEALVLDTRQELAFGAAHVPNALGIWRGGLASYVGWFAHYDVPILLVNEETKSSQAVRHLIRLGFDQVEGYLAGGMHAWHSAGLESASISAVTVQELCRRLDQKQDPWILDVRSLEEVREQSIPGAQHIHITQLPRRLEQVPTDRPVHVFCASARRAMAAASVLAREGWQNLVVVLGGLTGWNSVSCPLEWTA